MKNEKIEQYIDEIYELYRGMRDMNEELGDRMIELTSSNKENVKSLERMLAESRKAIEESQGIVKSIAGTFDLIKDYVRMIIMCFLIFTFLLAGGTFWYLMRFKSEMFDTARETYALHEQIKYITIEQYKILKDMQAAKIGEESKQEVAEQGLQSKENLKFEIEMQV